LVDSDGVTVDPPFELTETFHNYTTTTTLSAPPTLTVPISGTPFGDTQYFGKNWPACPGSNDHEEFDMHHSVKIGNTVYPLTTVFNVKRGKYAGVNKLDHTITIP
jgi:hypothetical protein